MFFFVFGPEGHVFKGQGPKGALQEVICILLEKNPETYSLRYVRMITYGFWVELVKFSMVRGQGHRGQGHKGFVCILVLHVNWGDTGIIWVHGDISQGGQAIFVLI